MGVTDEQTATEDTRTKGAIRFDAFMLGKNPTARPIVEMVAAVALTVTVTTIRAWRSGRYIPDWPTRRVIEGWSAGKIKAEWWCDQAELDRFAFADKITPYGTDATKSRRGRKG